MLDNVPDCPPITGDPRAAHEQLMRRASETTFVEISVHGTFRMGFAGEDRVLFLKTGANTAQVRKLNSPGVVDIKVPDQREVERSTDLF